MFNPEFGPAACLDLDGTVADRLLSPRSALAPAGCVREYISGETKAWHICSIANSGRRINERILDAFFGKRYSSKRNVSRD
jgi:hypothetical protein